MNRSSGMRTESVYVCKRIVIRLQQLYARAANIELMHNYLRKKKTFTWYASATCRFASTISLSVSAPLNLLNMRVANHIHIYV